MSPAAIRGASSGGRLFAYVLDATAAPPDGALAAHATYLVMLGSEVVAAGAFRDGRARVVCVIAGDDVSAESIARADPLVVFGFALYRVHELESVDQVDQVAAWA